jgi:diguanylate cyclase
MLDPVKPDSDTSRDRPPAPADKDDAAALAAEAIRLAEAHDTPPVPSTFAVWYAFASGRPERLCREIRKLIDLNGSISSYELDQLHHVHLSVTEEQRREQEVAGFRLDREISKATGLVQKHMDTNDRFVGSLKKSANTMTATTNPKQMSDAVEAILAANGKMRAESVKLNHSLNQIRAEVRKLAASLEQSRQNEFRDALTNVANRRYFDRALPRHITDAAATGQPLSIAFADLDHFKTINDNYGHPVGDDVLRYFAALLQKNIKGRDFVARYGGEEFVLLLPATSLDNAKVLIQQIKTELDRASLIVSKGKSSIGKVTCSFGIVQAHPGEEAGDLIKRADAKLYEAKNAGRNCIACDA